MFITLSTLLPASHLDTISLLLCERQPPLAAVVLKAGHEDEPLVVKGDAQIHGPVVPQEVVPLVHVYAGDLVGHDLVEEVFVGSAAQVGPVESQGTVDQLLDEENVLLGEPLLLKHRHQVVLLRKNQSTKYF